MRALQEVIGRELRWVKPGRSNREFELRAGESAVATLTWAGRSGVVGAVAEGRYRFSQQGWFRPRVLVHDASTEGVDNVIATFTQRGGALTFSDAHVLRWKQPRRFTVERAWQNDAATELVNFHPERAGTVVTIQPGAASLPDLPVLLLLGQYLLLLTEQQAQAATTAAIVPIISSAV